MILHNEKKASAPSQLSIGRKQIDKSSQLKIHTTCRKRKTILFCQFIALLTCIHYKKDLHDPGNHDGVITHTHLEPDILECEVKWALGSITMNKATGGDGIPVELFQIL